MRPFNFKRGRTSYPEEKEETVHLPLSDQNSWYYPSHGYNSEEEDTEVISHRGNWGKKGSEGARWARHGKTTAWGPGMDDWEAEERSRKRVKLLLPRERRSPSPTTLPHLSRSPSPPFVAPYPQPVFQHLSYSSFVMDKAVTHTFRSGLLDELEDATNGLIEGEATMKRALGRLWQVMSQDPEHSSPNTNNKSNEVVVPKREDDDMDANEQQEKRIARAPDLTPSIHKHFLFSCANNNSSGYEPSHFTSPETQKMNLERAMAVLRELQDDGREYIERLEEIREGLGDVRAHRDGIWDMVRERAIQELKETALAYAEGNTE
ncbi:hypothetical protein K435DRAFT_960822 [Dendrothele bispora CBS 962.96]|uniref:Transcriptional regulatory protein RXT2 N-terminal domain-containing protein n=1 Tax=Dendrothele bispora (strain CBS 962.96) TaxID=1314807 RepID=A0A4S8MSC0_DENBC|nr:hypothetical protein K435DRAFT_960822 [Dendrothele bispora CBS 962.96]